KELALQTDDNERPLVAELADRLGISDRHLRRILKTEYGASPQALAKTHRLLTAKKLLAESNFSLTEIAFASGFGGVRSFNHSFKHNYGLSPSSLKRNLLPEEKKLKIRQSIRLTLAFRPPLAFDEQLAFLRLRAIRGVE
ncbi:MAG TPA: helix-turn-helix domain-containing protein, partial [Candidatus Melainabacteria bacterium]|nr:helix-turn-helix domain-containing protein [Candidatus Melainabacteria bacterium]